MWFLPFAVLLYTDETMSCIEVVLVENSKGLNIHPLSRWVFLTEYKENVEVKLFVTVFGEQPDKSPVQLKRSPSKTILYQTRERGPELDYVSTVKFHTNEGIYKVVIKSNQNFNTTNSRCVYGDWKTLSWTRRTWTKIHYHNSPK